MILSLTRQSMTNRLLLLATGLFIFLAFTTPPAQCAAAAATSPTLSCDQDPCLFKLSGRILELNFGGNRIRCRSIAGGGQIRQISGSMVLDFENCREHVTVLGFRCSSTAQQTGPVRTNTLGAQLMRGTENVPKIVFLGLRVSFKCAGVLKFSNEGFLVGHLDRRQCNNKASEYALAPVLFAHGAIGSEPFYDIYTNADKRTYKIPGPWQMEFRRGATLRC